VGLGTGSVAAYVRPTDRLTFFEIDPLVIKVATTLRRFHYTTECAQGPVDYVVGDARLTIAKQPAGVFDVLLIDAFSSDAVPMHLMTTEAFDSYARALAPNGLLLVHISNRFLALSPVVAGAAAQGKWHAARMVYQPGVLELRDEAAVSDWIALSRDPATLARLTGGDPRWEVLKPRPGFAPWTDDYASVVPVMRAFHPSLANE